MQHNSFVAQAPGWSWLRSILALPITAVDQGQIDIESWMAKIEIEMELLFMRWIIEIVLHHNTKFQEFAALI